MTQGGVLSVIKIFLRIFALDMTMRATSGIIGLTTLRTIGQHTNGPHQLTGHLMNVMNSTHHPVIINTRVFMFVNITHCLTMYIGANGLKVRDRVYYKGTRLLEVATNSMFLQAMGLRAHKDGRRVCL